MFLFSLVSPVFLQVPLLLGPPRCVSLMERVRVGAGSSAVGEAEVIRFEEEDLEPQTSPLCLIGKVLTNRAFNAFGFLETMKRAMKPSKGLTIREVGKNLFSFQFHSREDLLDVLRREPWHFEKNLLILKEIGRGEQPSLVKFDSTGIWLRMYDLPISMRTENRVKTIGAKSGRVVEVDKRSLEGIGRSVRVKVQIDITTPLKIGVNVEQKNSEPVWIPFKYERLPTFCYVCGTLGHMRRECDFVEEVCEIKDLPEERLSFGDWLRASPLKKASVITSTSIRRKLFEKFRRDLQEETQSEEGNEQEFSEQQGKGRLEGEAIEMFNQTFERVRVGEKEAEQEEGGKKVKRGIL